MPPAFVIPRGVTHSNFATTFGVRIIDSLVYRVALFAWSYI